MEEFSQDISHDNNYGAECSHNNQETNEGYHLDLKLADLVA